MHLHPRRQLPKHRLIAHNPAAHARPAWPTAHRRTFTSVPPSTSSISMYSRSPCLHAAGDRCKLIAHARRCCIDGVAAAACTVQQAAAPATKPTSTNASLYCTRLGCRRLASRRSSFSASALQVSEDSWHQNKLLRPCTWAPKAVQRSLQAVTSLACRPATSRQTAPA